MEGAKMEGRKKKKKEEKEKKNLHTTPPLRAFLPITAAQTHCRALRTPDKPANITLSHIGSHMYTKSAHWGLKTEGKRFFRAGKKKKGYQREWRETST